MTELLRTSRDGCWQVTSNTWGQYLAPIFDPLADTVITDEQFNGFELHPDITPIPSALWTRWVQLCIEMTRRNSANLEVSCRLLRQGSNYRIFVPEQTVTPASVRVESFDKAVDIETGEVVTSWPPEGWRPCGSSHSHNTMDAFFSGTDDKYELGDPGLHIVVGNINIATGQYTLKASITANKRRFNITADKVVNLTATTDTYHPSVLDVITLPKKATPSITTSAINRPAVTTQNFDFDLYSSPELINPYASSDAERVKEEINDVLDAVDRLVKACQGKQIDAPIIMRNLATEIDEQACELDLDFTEDPFYWSSY